MAYKSSDIQEVLATLPVNDTNEIRVSAIKSEDGVLKSVDLRQWYYSEKDDEMRPTQKGVRVKEDQLDNLIKSLILAVSSEVYYTIDNTDVWFTSKQYFDAHDLLQDSDDLGYILTERALVECGCEFCQTNCVLLEGELTEKVLVSKMKDLGYTLIRKDDIIESLGYC